MRFIPAQSLSLGYLTKVSSYARYETENTEKNEKPSAHYNVGGTARKLEEDIKPRLLLNAKFATLQSL